MTSPPTLPGKRTLAVILGDTRTRILYAACALTPFAVAAALAPARPLTLLTFAALPLARARSARSGTGRPSGPDRRAGHDRPAQLAFGALLTIGLAIQL